MTLVGVHIDVRPAAPSDVVGICSLSEPWVALGDLLPLTPVDVMQGLNHFVVAVTADGGVVGCVSLKAYGGHLAEVRSLAVADGYQQAGVGRRMIAVLLQQARQRDFNHVFALTRRPGFFLRLGFEEVEKDRFPEKIWNDCRLCPRRDACDEIAVLISVEGVEGVPGPGDLDRPPES